MVSDAGTHLVGPLVIGRYVTDVRGFSGGGDSFTEHKRHVSMVLMIVLKYLAGQIFSPKCEFRAMHTGSPQDCSKCYEV